MPPEPRGALVRNTVVMLVLAILAAATWVATWSPQDQSPPAERSEGLGPLGYYVRGARLSGTDEQGRVTYRIRAERLDELPAEDQLRLEGVNVEYQPADGHGVGDLRGERERAEGRLAARPVRQRRGSQHARGRLRRR